MKALACASRLLRLLPEVAWSRTNAQLSLLSSRAIFGGGGGSREGAIAMRDLPAPLQACSTHNSAYLIPTLSATIKCSGNIADGLVEALMSFGASSVSIENGASDGLAKEDNENGPVAWSNEKRQFWNQVYKDSWIKPARSLRTKVQYYGAIFQLKEDGLMQRFVYRDVFMSDAMRIAIGKWGPTHDFNDDT